MDLQKTSAFIDKKKGTRVISITVTLKPEQKINPNQWEVTIAGERRIIPKQVVTWYTNSLERAVASISFSQVYEITIKDESEVYLKFGGFNGVFQ